MDDIHTTIAQTTAIISGSIVVYTSGREPVVDDRSLVPQISRSLEEFEVKEKTISYLTQMCPNVRVMNMACVGFHPKMQVGETFLECQLTDFFLNL